MTGELGSAVVRCEATTLSVGSRTLWRDLDLAVAPGEFLAVLGGNGAGKTSLLRLLLGQLRPASGRVETFGGPSRRGDRRVGYVPQQRAFNPDLTLRGVDLVRLGVTGHRWGLRPPSPREHHRVAQALEAVEATSFAAAPVGTLSGGEQQRLRIAQALVSEPALLLADEPLLSLDQASQRRVTGLLDTHRRTHGAAVVMVTHEINPVLPYVDQVLYLTPTGWAAGPPEQVLTTDTLSRLYQAPVEVVRVRDQLLIVGVPDDHHHVTGTATPATEVAG